MSCHRKSDATVLISVEGFMYPKQGGGVGEMVRMHRGHADCGWDAPTIGTENQAYHWARMHVLTVHAALVACAPGDHEPKRDSYCRRCDQDCLSSAERQLVIARAWGGVIPDVVA